MASHYNKRIHFHAAKLLGLGRCRCNAWSYNTGPVAFVVDVAWDRPLGEIKTEKVHELIAYLAGALPLDSMAIIAQSGYKGEQWQDVIFIFQGAVKRT